MNHNAKDILVSVCVPTYNGSKFIRQSIESILAQDYENIEIIVNDDCSTDNTLDIVREFEDPRIKISVNEHNCGLVGNWNQTMAKAHGQYIKLVFQDDILCPQAISKQVELMEKYPQATLSIGNTSVIDQNSKVIMKRSRFNKDELISGKNFARKSFRSARNIYSEPPNLFFRRSAIEEVGEFDGELSYTPDWDYGVRLSYAGDVVVTSTEIMRFRVSNYSETNRLYSQKEDETFLDSMVFFRKHKKMGVLQLTDKDEKRFYWLTKLNDFMRNVVMKVFRK